MDAECFLQCECRVFSSEWQKSVFFSVNIGHFHQYGCKMCQLVWIASVLSSRRYMAAVISIQSACRSRVCSDKENKNRYWQWKGYTCKGVEGEERAGRGGTGGGGGRDRTVVFLRRRMRVVCDTR